MKSEMKSEGKNLESDQKGCENWKIRYKYYQIHTEDKDANVDEDPEIRNYYYRTHPEDEDIKR